MAALAGISAIAQPAPISADSLAKREAFSLKQKLSLSSAQQGEIEQMARRHHTSLQRVREQRMDTAARSRVLQQIQKAYLHGLKGVLTPAQYKRYEEIVARQEVALKERARGKGVRVKALPKS